MSRVRISPEFSAAPITVEVSYRSVTDLPLVGPLFPDPTLHSRVSMRVEK